MAYCTQAQVESEFADITFSSTTKVTDTDVARFIAETDALIDGRLGLKYQVPIVGASSLVIVRMIAIAIVAARVRKILEIQNSTPGTSQQVQGKDQFDPWKALDQIVKGELKLSDSSLASTEDGIASYVAENSDTVEPHVMKLGQDQW